MNRKAKLRWGFAILFIILTVVMIVYTVSSYNAVSIKKGIKDIPYNELIKASIDGKLDVSKSLFQVGLVSLAALWGLVIAKKDEASIVLSKNPELVTFICASLLLLLSLVSHVLYLETILSGFSDAGLAFDEANKTIIDLFDPKFDYLFNWQINNLFAGTLTAIFTLFSAHKLNR